MNEQDGAPDAKPQVRPNLDEIAAQLHLLRDNYAAELPARIERLRALNEQLSIRFDTATLREFHRVVHGLTGSGKTYGFSKLSDEARKFESVLQAAVEKN